MVIAFVADNTFVNSISLPNLMPNFTLVCSHASKKHFFSSKYRTGKIEKIYVSRRTYFILKI